jgi:hypothetical protein
MTVTNMDDFIKGIPYFIYDQGSLRIFELKLCGGAIVRAYLDPTNQYSADGPTWRLEANNTCISKSQVDGFRCIDGIPAFRG